MVTLATAVNTTETTWALSEALPAGTEYLQADDELVAVITPALQPSQRDPATLFCEVERGVAGTLATHAQGITLATLAAPPLGAGSGEQAVYSVTATLTDAQVKALPTTPVEIVPAPGAGQLLVPLFAVLVLDWTADYTNIDGNAIMEVKVGDEIFTTMTAGDAFDVLAFGGDSLSVMLPVQKIGLAFTAAAVGKVLVTDEPIILSGFNGASGNWTGGNAANTLKFSCAYIVMDLA